MFGALVTLVGGADVPDVGFERVAAAADAHFGEVADGVFGFRETWTGVLVFGASREKAMVWISWMMDGKGGT